MQAAKHERLIMSFDEIPENKTNSAPCPNCVNGNAIEDKQGNWRCDTCDWCFVKGDKDNTEDNQ